LYSLEKKIDVAYNNNNHKRPDAMMIKITKKDPTDCLKAVQNGMQAQGTLIS